MGKHRFFLVGAAAFFAVLLILVGCGDIQVSDKDKGETKESAIPLIEDVWAGGILSEGKEQWFKFTSIGTMYRIDVDFITVTDLWVQVYNSVGYSIGSRTYLSSHDINRSITLTLTSGTYYIKVWPFSTLGNGTYRIGINTAPWQVGTTITALTENIWNNGLFLEKNRTQWFSYTADAGSLWIYVYFGTLTNLYVQVYDSAYVPIDTATNLFGISYNVQAFPLTLRNDEVYYIKVWPYSLIDIGSYRIAFNTSGTAPQ